MENKLIELQEILFKNINSLDKIKEIQDGISKRGIERLSKEDIK